MASQLREHDHHSVNPSTRPSEGASALARLGWMLFGPLALLLLALVIAKRPEWDLGLADVAFAAVLFISSWVRRLDVVRFQGTTANGAPASLADVRVYVVGLLALGVTAWVLAHSVALGAS